MAEHLASLRTGYCEPETVYNVVKPALQKLEQVFTCYSLAPCSRLVIVSELLFKHAIGAANLLLFTQLKRIFRQPLAPAVAVLAWRLVELALWLKAACRAFEPEINALTARQLAGRSNISSHCFSLVFTCAP